MNEQPYDVGTHAYLFRIPADLYNRLKLEAFTTSKPISKLIVKAIEDRYINKPEKAQPDYASILKECNFSQAEGGNNVKP